MAMPRFQAKKTDNKIITYLEVVEKAKRNPIRKKDYQERVVHRLNALGLN